MSQDLFTKDVVLMLGNSWKHHWWSYYHKWRAF